jgi:hypothetical protein
LIRLIRLIGLVGSIGLIFLVGLIGLHALNILILPATCGPASREGERFARPNATTLAITLLRNGVGIVSSLVIKSSRKVAIGLLTLDKVETAE